MIFIRIFLSQIPIAPEKLWKHLSVCEFCSNLRKKIKSVKFVNGKESHYFTSIPFRSINHPAELWYLLWLSPNWFEIHRTCRINLVEYDQIFRMSRNTSRTNHETYGTFHPIDINNFQSTIDEYSKRWKFTLFKPVLENR